ncbi:MAG: RidA family protein [Sphingomonas sp.]
MKITVYLRTREARAAVNEAWRTCFPDPASRPARHTLVSETLPKSMLVQCDATAFIFDSAAPRTPP